jgi:alkaline phosphatase
VSTAFIADATPAALTAHTRDRGQYGHVVDTYVHGITNYTWTNWTGPDVLFGGGAEQFIPGPGSYQGKDYYKEFSNAGYNVIWNNTALQKAVNSTKTLGIFCIFNMVSKMEPSRQLTC